MSTNILCHIVGLNEIMKESLKNEIGNIDDVVIKDLDEITHKLRFDSTLDKLDIKTIKLKSKLANGNRNLDIINDHRRCSMQYNKLWKNVVTKKLYNLCKKNKKKKIILLGLSTHHKNSKLRINIESKYKYTVNIESRKSTKQVVEYNINKYKKHIINGTFPLKYLDHEFLTKQKKNTEKIYKNLGYKPKSLVGVVKWIQLKVDYKPSITSSQILPKNNTTTKATDNLSPNQNNKPTYNSFLVDKSVDENRIYYLGRKDKYINENIIAKKKKRWIQDEDINKMFNNKPYQKTSAVSQEKYITYDVEWLGILSAFIDSNKYIKKGYLEYKDKKIPYIEERIKDGFLNLDTDVYLYKFSNLHLNKIGYKYIGFGTNLYQTGTEIYVENALNKLKKIGVKLIKYNKIKQYNKYG